MPAATATAEPPLEPPATRSKSTALCVGPKALFSVEPPWAKASRLALPIKMASSLSNRSIAVASMGDSKFSKILAAAVVWPIVVKKLSLATYGTPASRPTCSPRLILASISSARCSASSSNVSSSACNSSLSWAARRAFSTSALAVVWPDLILLTISLIKLVITIPLAPLLDYSLCLALGLIVSRATTEARFYRLARHSVIQLAEKLA